jgi:crotonobetainyl-CoA:carnitine CoA-transferase CaiB-like acyl-CoA transferase
VDVSLLGTGMWSMGAALALSLQHNVGWAPPPVGAPTGNPLSGTYRTRDGKFISLTCLQAAKYWGEACEVLGLPELAGDERFATAEAIRENVAEATDAVREAFTQRDAAEWRERLAGFSGQWASVQDTLEVASDPQAVANGYVQECKTAEGVAFGLAAAPVQYGGEPAVPRRAPEFNEHGDAILGGLGLDTETILDLKVRGVVA